MDHKYLSVDSVDLAYTEKNIAAKKTIFFIHGNSMSAAMWDKQFKSELFSKYRLIAFDLPSHGNSSVPKDQEVVYKEYAALFSGYYFEGNKNFMPKRSLFSYRAFTGGKYYR